jgi:hypothetical protein
MKSKIKFLFFIILLNASCSKDQLLEPQEIISEGVIPLKVGYKWTWEVTSYNEEGVKIDSHLYYNEVIKDTIINGENWFILMENGNPPTYLGTNRNGVYYSFYLGQPTITFNTVIEDTSVESTNSNGSYLVSKNNLIQGPLGEFNCNLYQVFIKINENKFLEANYYLEYNKGIIRTESFSLNMNGSSYIAVTTELVSTNAF